LVYAVFNFDTLGVEQVSQGCRSVEILWPKCGRNVINCLICTLWSQFGVKLRHLRHPCDTPGVS